MEKTSSWRRLGSYSVNQRLIEGLEDFINHKLPRILYSGKGVTDLSDHSYLVLIGSKESEIYYPIGKYTQQQFHNDIQKMVIGLKYKSYGRSTDARAIVLELGSGKSIGDTELLIALHDDKGEEKLRLIEEGLLAVMEPYRNHNGVTYPNEFLPTFVFVVGFLIGIGTLMFEQPILKSLCFVLFCTAIWFVSRRFTKGYCHFESPRQRWLDKLQKGLSIALVLSALAAVILFFRVG
jgi:hypothetical protein